MSPSVSAAKDVAVRRSSPLRPAARGIWSDQGLDAVEHLMQRLCMGTGGDPLSGITLEHLSTGGKRVRARLALAAGEALGLDRSAVIAWAAACELLHNATLLHDDVQDGDRVRRGKPAAWVTHGVAQAINAGDLMLMLPTSALDQLWADDGIRWGLSRLLARDAQAIVRGQALELTLLEREAFDWESYEQACIGKTAALFAMPVEGAAIMAGYSRADAAALAAPFRRLGLLFQIQDDVLDLYGDKGRDVVGSDLYEGKVSALVCEHLCLFPDDRAWLVSLLQAPREQTPVGDVHNALAWFRDGGALEAAWRRMEAVQDEVEEDPALSAHVRLQALATSLVAMAIAPIAHTLDVSVSKMEG